MKIEKSQNDFQKWGLGSPNGDWESQMEMQISHALTQLRLARLLARTTELNVISWFKGRLPRKTLATIKSPTAISEFSCLFWRYLILSYYRMHKAGDSGVLLHFTYGPITTRLYRGFITEVFNEEFDLF